MSDRYTLIGSTNYEPEFVDLAYRRVRPFLDQSGKPRQITADIVRWDRFELDAAFTALPGVSGIANDN